MALKRFNGWHLDLMIWMPGALALISCAVLEYLAEYKAGVMRHLYYRKMEHLMGVYAPDMLFLHLSFIAVILICAMLLSDFRRLPKRSIASLFLSSGLLSLAFYSAALSELYTYTYLLFTMEVITLSFAVLFVIRRLAGNRPMALSSECR